MGLKLPHTAYTWLRPCPCCSFLSSGFDHHPLSVVDSARLPVCKALPFKHDGEGGHRSPSAIFFLTFLHQCTEWLLFFLMATPPCWWWIIGKHLIPFLNVYSGVCVVDTYSWLFISLFGSVWGKNACIFLLWKKSFVWSCKLFSPLIRKLYKFVKKICDRKFSLVIKHTIILMFSIHFFL